MALKPEFVCGIFRSEIKNRFLCSVCIEGEDAVCYIPSSCRLSNFIDLTGRAVLLKPIMTPKARTSYSVYAVKYGRNYILLNLAQANKVIEEQLHKRYFSFLGKRKHISHEIKLGNYKTDLFIHDTNTLVEVKSILAFDKEASFPTVYSERAVKQLREISKLLDAGYNACYMLVSLNPKVKRIAINNGIEDFYQLFSECVNKGMTYYAVSVRLVEQEPELYSRIIMTL
ncbi:DNA/RNA nuclease SfsA [Caproiciproducens sp. R1]|uniref:DNA/RNA nuclease SfsA n=1 Tax=Caproiciproducens sp. R1 TaxID=3435000 RepID=UPI004034BF73